MPLKGLLITLALISSSCAGLPQKPNVELGVIDYPSAQVITNMTGSKSFQKIQMPSDVTYKAVLQATVTDGARVPLSTYDRAICFKPNYWQAVQDYVNALNRYIENSCQATH